MIQRTVIPTRVASTRPVLLVLAVLLLLRPAPAHAGQDAEDKTSPFASLRWNGDVPEVLVQGDWYRPLVIHDVGVEDILAFLRRTQPSRVRKRFGEDLPETIRNMGRMIPARVDLTLVRLAAGERVELAAVAPEPTDSSDAFDDVFLAAPPSRAARRAGAVHRQQRAPRLGRELGHGGRPALLLPVSECS